MLGSITSFFLKNYADKDVIIQKKARILFWIVSAIAILIVPMYIAFSIVYDWRLNLQVLLIFMAAMLFLTLAILYAGHFIVSSHLFLVLCFAAIWSFFFIDLDATNYIDRMSSLVLLLAVLNFIPLIIVRRKHIIIAYYTLNTAILCAFFYTVWSTSSIPQATMASYSIDAVVAFLMSGIVSYQLISVNLLAADRAKTAEAEIRKSEELFRGMVEESPQFTIIINQDGTLDFPDSVKSLPFGLKREEIPTLERLWETAYPDEGYRRLIKAEFSIIMREVAEGHPVKSIETKVMSRDGSYSDAMIRYSPLGQSGRGLMLFDDITNRKIIERSLQASERRYRKLYDSMLDGFVSLDMDGTILEFNTAYLKMTGHTAAELYEMTVWDLTPHGSTICRKRSCRSRSSPGAIPTSSRRNIYEKTAL